jgi:hypothetical protein
MTVWFGGYDGSGADCAARSTGAVLNDNGLPEGGAHFVRQEPCHDVGRTARRGTDYEFDWPIREGLRALKDQKRRDEQDQSADDFLLHTHSLKVRERRSGAATNALHIRRGSLTD